MTVGKPDSYHLREDCLKPLGLPVTEGARRLGIERRTRSNPVNEKTSVSIGMAYRLSKALGSTGPELSGQTSSRIGGAGNSRGSVCGPNMIGPGRFCRPTARTSRSGRPGAWPAW